MTAYTGKMTPAIPLRLAPLGFVEFVHPPAESVGTMVPATVPTQQRSEKIHGVFWPVQPAAPTAQPVAPAYTTESLAANTAETGLLTVTGAVTVINGISTSAPVRVRLYTTVEKRDADLARAIGTDPTGDHGLLFEVVTTTGQLSYQVSPGVYISTDSPTVPVTVTNLSGSAQTVTVTISAIVLE